MPSLLDAPTTPRRVALVLNPASGSEGASIRRARLVKAARTTGISDVVLETHPQEGAAPAVRKALQEGAERIVVSGGDGTLAQAAGELAGTKVALGVAPSGTANLFALNMCVPSDPDDALALAMSAPARSVDVGWANGRAFLVMAGLGADAQVVRDAKRRKKRFLGVLAYLIGGWRMVMGGQARYTVSIDGVTLRRRAKTVLVANLGRLPAGAVLVPDTSAEDGLLEVAIIRAWSVPQMLRVVARALAGRPANDNLLEVHRGQHITVRCSRPRPLHLDGEDSGSTMLLEAHVDPGALRVALPPAPGGPSASSPTYGSLRSLRTAALSWLPYRSKRHQRRALARA